MLSCCISLLLLLLKLLLQLLLLLHRWLGPGLLHGRPGAAAATFLSKVVWRRGLRRRTRGASGPGAGEIRQMQTRRGHVCEVDVESWRLRTFDLAGLEAVVVGSCSRKFMPTTTAILVAAASPRTAVGKLLEP